MNQSEMEKDKAYIYDGLYLPKSKIRLAGISNSLEFRVQGDKGNNIVKLWEDLGSHMKVPRNFLRADKRHLYNFEFINKVPNISDFPKIDFDCNIKLKNESQQKAAAAIHLSSGILNLNTGKGKTVVALYNIATTSSPALIVVHNSTLKNQWIEKIKKFFNNPDIGIIEGAKFDWKHSITIAMVKTLANRIKEGKVTDEFRSWFSTVYYDEVHHFGAPVFSTTADVCLGQRIGLTATPIRSDGLDVIIKYHIGPILYSDMEYDLIPEIFFIETPVRIKKFDHDNLFSMITKLSKNTISYNFRLKWLKKIYEQCNKIIVIGSRLEMLKSYAAEFKDSCLLIRETPIEERAEQLKKSKIAFAIGSLGLEGLDDEELDSVVFLTPMGGDSTFTERGKEFLGNQIRQGFGRILRDNGKDKKPKAFFFDDIDVDDFSDLNVQVRAFLKNNKFKYEDIK